MDLTIYTLGSVEIIRGMLNAVAMVFGTGMFTSSTGGPGSVVLVGLLISLILILGNAGFLGAFGGKGFNPGMLLVLLVVFTVLVVPKSRVQIEDVYTGTVTAVDNVPLGVALPGAVISSITRNIAEKMNVAFSTTDGNYISMSARGFVSPLALLQALRGMRADGRVVRPGTKPNTFGNNIYLDATIRNFVLYCVRNSDTFSPGEFKRTSNVIKYITENYRDGLTTKFSASEPQGVGATCLEVAAYIKTEAPAFLNGSSGTGASQFLDGLLNLNAPNPASPNSPVPGRYSADDLREVHERLIQPVFGALQDSESFMLNAIWTARITDTFDCAAQDPTVAAINACEITMVQARELFRSDAAASGTFFRSIMIQSMSMLQALFYGFAPLVFAFSMMMGQFGLSVLAKYMLFGIWTQTWLPFAVVINYFAQLSFATGMRKLAGGTTGLTPESFQPFYNEVATSIALAGDMMAAVPMISLALLTGSVFSLTSLAQRWSGRDNVDETLLSPQLAKSAPAYQGGGVAAAATMVSMSRNTGFGIKESAPNPEFSVSVTRGSGVASQTRASQQLVETAVEQGQRAYSDTQKDVLAALKNKERRSGETTSAGKDWARGSDSANDYVRSLGGSVATAAQVETDARAALAFKAGFTQNLTRDLLDARKGGLKLAEGKNTAEAQATVQKALDTESKVNPGFAASLARGDEAAIGKAVDVASNALLVGGLVAAPFTGGTTAVAATAGRAVVTTAARGAIVSSVAAGTRAMGRIGKIGEKISAAGALAAGLFGDAKAQQEASLQIGLKNSESFSQSTDEKISQTAKTASTYREGTFGKFDSSSGTSVAVGTSRTAGAEKTESMSKSFSQSYQASSSSEQSFARTGSLDSGSGVSVKMDAQKLLFLLQQNPEQWAAIERQFAQSQFDATQMQRPGFFENDRRAGQLLQGIVQGPSTNPEKAAREREILRQAIALSLDGQALPLSPDVGGLDATANQNVAEQAPTNNPSDAVRGQVEGGRSPVPVNVGRIAAPTDKVGSVGYSSPGGAAPLTDAAKQNVDGAAKQQPKPSAKSFNLQREDNMPSTGNVTEATVLTPIGGAVTTAAAIAGVAGALAHQKKLENDVLVEKRDAEESRKKAGGEAAKKDQTTPEKKNTGYTKPKYASGAPGKGLVYTPRKR